jgi:MFS family permease
LLRNPSTALLLAAVLVVGAGQTVVFAIVPAISRSIGLTEIESSLIFTASASAIFLTSQLWGRASDKFGRLPVVLFGLTSYGILLALLAYILGVGLSGGSGSFVFAGLIACRTLHGALTAGVLPASQAHLADESDSTERVGGMAAVSLAFGLGSLVGPGVVQLLAPLGSLAGLWCFSLVAIGLAAILVVLARRPEREPRTSQPPTAALKFTPALIGCLMVSSGFHIAFLGTMQITGFIVQDRFHYSASAAVSLASYTFLLIAIAMILTQALMVKFRSNEARSLAISGSLIGVAAYLTASFDFGWAGAVLAPALLGISLALVLPSVSAIASFAANAHGAALGAIGATQALGFLIGPLLASYLYSIGHSLPLNVDAAILLLCALVAARLPRGLQHESDGSMQPGAARRSS